MAEFAEEVDKNQRDMEERIKNELNSQLEFQVDEINVRLDQTIRELEDKMQVNYLTQSQATTIEKRKNLIKESLLQQTSNFDPSKMEAALNDWLLKVEEQVNLVEG